MLHKFLVKQLERSELDTTKITALQQTQWIDFLTRVSNYYYDYEQERYLLERAMEISAREYNELHDRLKDAQELAHMGYFYTDIGSKKMSWSTGMFDLTGIDPQEGVPTLDEALKMVHKEDRSNLKEKIKKAFSQGVPYVMELRWKNQKKGEYVWCQVKGVPTLESDSGPDNIKVKYLSGIVMDVSDRKKNEELERRENSQMLSLCRRSGMAEIVVSVLHNIGNVLNTVNVSVGLLKEISERPVYEKVKKISDLLKDNSGNITEYLFCDDKGKIIPGYLLDLLPMIEGAHQEIKHEVENLMVNVAHIKNIVSNQNSLSGASGIIETVVLEELIDTAMHIANHEKHSQQIEFKKLFKKVPSVYVDKSKLLQICVNLIQNAKDAVLKKEGEESKQVTLYVGLDNKYIFFKVQDNGVGITPEEAKKIFSFGFTTKKDGHGFGLHSSILAAKELGGNLIFESYGKNQGATFILTLPIMVKDEE